jgi:hypothetical protein
MKTMKAGFKIEEDQKHEEKKFSTRVERDDEASHNRLNKVRHGSSGIS